MAINKLNYEAYMLDFMEGNLKGELLEEMEAFLAEHPAIAAELEGLEDVILEPEAIVFSDKASLKKTRSIILSPWLLGVAASLLLVVSFLLGMEWQKNEKPIEVADQNTIELEKEGPKEVPISSKHVAEAVVKDVVKELNSESKRAVSEERITAKPTKSPAKSVAKQTAKFEEVLKVDKSAPEQIEMNTVVAENKSVKEEPRSEFKIEALETKSVVTLASNDQQEIYIKPISMPQLNSQTSEAVAGNAKRKVLLDIPKLHINDLVEGLVPEAMVAGIEELPVDKNNKRMFPKVKIQNGIFKKQ